MCSDFAGNFEGALKTTFIQVNVLSLKADFTCGVIVQTHLLLYISVHFIIYLIPHVIIASQKPDVR